MKHFCASLPLPHANRWPLCRKERKISVDTSSIDRAAQYGGAICRAIQSQSILSETSYCLKVLNYYFPTSLNSLRREAKFADADAIVQLFAIVELVFTQRAIFGTEEVNIIMQGVYDACARM